MNSELQPIDITNAPELRRLVDQVRSAKKPLRLQTDGRDVAVVSPLTVPASKRALKTAADREAFLSSFGGWRGLVDVDKLKEGMAQSRRIRARPPVEV